LQIVDQKNERPEVKGLGEKIEEGIEDAFPPRPLRLVNRRFSLTDQLRKDEGEVKSIFRAHTLKDPDAFVLSLVEEGDENVGQ
jgi:hypothetical protein